MNCIGNVAFVISISAECVLDGMQCQSFNKRGVGVANAYMHTLSFNSRKAQIDIDRGEQVAYIKAGKQFQNGPYKPPWPSKYT